MLNIQNHKTSEASETHHTLKEDMNRFFKSATRAALVIALPICAVAADNAAMGVEPLSRCDQSMVSPALGASACQASADYCRNPTAAPDTPLMALLLSHSPVAPLVCRPCRVPNSDQCSRLINRWRSST